MQREVCDTPMRNDVDDRGFGEKSERPEVLRVLRIRRLVPDDASAKPGLMVQNKLVAVQQGPPDIL